MHKIRANSQNINKYKIQQLRIAAKHVHRSRIYTRRKTSPGSSPTSPKLFTTYFYSSITTFQRVVIIWNVRKICHWWKNVWVIREHLDTVLQLGCLIDTVEHPSRSRPSNESFKVSRIYWLNQFIAVHTRLKVSAGDTLLTGKVESVNVNRQFYTTKNKCCIDSAKEYPLVSYAVGCLFYLNYTGQIGPLFFGLIYASEFRHAVHLLSSLYWSTIQCLYYKH